MAFSTPIEQPMSVFYPDEGTVEVRISGSESLLFRERDQIDDYWYGEAAAGNAG